MTDYTETKQDREDADKLKALSLDASILNVLYNTALQLKPGRARRIMQAIEQEKTWVLQSKQDIVKQGEDRIAAFYTDRAKVKRALAALRKLGYVASISEPSYESALDTTPKLAEAQNAGMPWLAVSTKEWRYAFQGPRAYYSAPTEQGDTLTHSLYFSWGPTSPTGGREAIGHEIVAAFQAEGLDVSWDGSAARCVQVVGEAEKAEYEAEQRTKWEAEHGPATTPAGR